jgi:hypothetical protein
MTYKIFTVGFELPGDEFEFIDIDSDRTLLDADIVLFEPGLPRYDSIENYNGKPLLTEHASFRAHERLQHWRTELSAAVRAGKLVVFYLERPVECFRHTGRRERSGTGRSMVTTNIVTEVSSYECLPLDAKVSAKSGTKVRIERDASFLSAYWSEFAELSPYKVSIDSGGGRPILKSNSGHRVVGSISSEENGTLLLLPPLQLDEDEFFYENDGEEYWTEQALQLGKRLSAAVVGLAKALKASQEQTPPPDWVKESGFRIPEEIRIEEQIEDVTESISALQTERGELEDRLNEVAKIRGLLYEQGKPLEKAILNALEAIGFTAEPYEDAESEFDSVFSSAEGRCLGEAEGKDTKAINIAKMTQLERNLQEDFAREDVEAFAKGVLFGNAYRLTELSERDYFFTTKCHSAAKRTGVALVRTPDLFAPAVYMLEHPNDTKFATQCREAVYESSGEVVQFPAPPGSLNPDQNQSNSHAE